jgi:hypothetical protein
VADIQAAQAQCLQILKGLDLVAVGVEPIREGDCGAAAPIELVSVGTNPQVTFSPTVTVTCEMAKALHTWVTRDLQPLARRHLGAPLIRVDTMSSYSCRTAYGRAKNRLSEHGKANAIDIRGFVTARAETADVRADWGPTERLIQAQIAAAKAAEAKAAAERAVAAKSPFAPSQGSSPAPGTTVAGANPSVAVPEVSVGVRGVPIEVPSIPNAIGITTGFPQPSRLGGPKQAATPVPSRQTASSTAQGRRAFMRGVHQTACRVFGTVLGPEANQAHENHFHVDAAKRNLNVVICE